MINTLKALSAELCKSVLNGLQHTPKNHVFAQAYTKPSLMTAMYHVMGFDGKKLERVANVDENALKKYCFFLVRPFYHNLHVTIYVNTGKCWDRFGSITRRKVEFDPRYSAVAFKQIQNEAGWRNQIQATGIVQLKAPTTDTLPTMTNVIKRFGSLLEQGDLGEFVLATLDGMTRSGDLPTYVRAAMSVLHFDVEVKEGLGIALSADIEGATIKISFAEGAVRAPVDEHLLDNAKISDQLKKIREVPTTEYPAFFDIVMLRAVKNTLVIIPFEKWQAHSIKLHTEGHRRIDLKTEVKTLILEAYMRPKDNKDKRHIHVTATIEVKE